MKSESSESSEQKPGASEVKSCAPYKRNKLAVRRWHCERCAKLIDPECPIVCNPCRIALLKEVRAQREKTHSASPEGDDVTVDDEYGDSDCSSDPDMSDFQEHDEYDDDHHASTADLDAIREDSYEAD